MSSFNFDDIYLSIGGNVIEPTYIQSVRVDVGKYTEVEVSGYITDEQLVGGEKMGYEKSTLGSYGYAVKCLAEGLANAVDREFLTAEEAKEEFRMHVNVVKEKDNREAYIKHLEDQIEKLKEGKPALLPGPLT
jgi:hypothetical protein